MANLFDFIGRIFISSIFLLSGYNKIFNYADTVAWMKGFGIPGFLLWPTIVLEILLPVLIIIGYRTQISAILLAIFCITTALIFHFDFSNQMQVIAFLKNFALAGGFLFIAVHGPKEWSMERKKKYVRL
jgi:putative oxidoreductase